MINIRLRDSILYILGSTLLLVVTVYGVSKFHWRGLLLVGLVFVGIADVLFFERSKDIYRMSRMIVFFNWLWRALLYTLLLYWWSWNHDIQWSLGEFVKYYGTMVLLPLLFKLIFLSWSSHRLKSGAVNYKTLIVGDGRKAKEVYHQLVDKRPSMGQLFIGNLGNQLIDPKLPLLGTKKDIENLISSHQIEEIIIALDQDQSSELIIILDTIRSLPHELMVRISPASYDFLLGTIRLDAVYNEPLIELPSGRLVLWQSMIKRSFDVVMSILVLLILSPLIVFIVVMTWRSSPGPVIYSQTRIGRYHKPFAIYKFRSMKVDAESGDLPQLSYTGDPRCTPWGTFMRKWRLDEIPQFVNVLLGNMSIVGPRPEREFFINEIKKQAPFYSRILTVRPGITSWGQVKFGYASDINQMVKRLHYDLIYVENQSLKLDIKIILYTILVLIQGKGK